MYNQVLGDLIFIMLYAAVTTMAIMASCYLLFRRGNAFIPDIKPPERLRRLTAIFFAFIVLNRVWYMPILFHLSSVEVKMIDLVGGLIDSLTILPLAIIILFSMLQDRERPLWPIVALTAPYAIGNAICVATRNDFLYPILYVYAILSGIGLIIYMVCAARQYGRWLRNNYADLEHKEVFRSFMVLAIMLMMFVINEFCSKGLVYLYMMQVIVAVVIGYFTWRVETLSDLSIHANDAKEEHVATERSEDYEENNEESNTLSLSIRHNIEPLLKQYCEEAQLYLQHDISISQLAKLIGVNRSYLSKHFATQGITYNAYINGLRIRHFTNLYHEAVESHQPITVRQLAHKSGFRSYSTFNAVFKQSMGMTATEWMRNVTKQEP